MAGTASAMVGIRDSLLDLLLLERLILPGLAGFVMACCSYQNVINAILNEIGSGSLFSHRKGYMIR